jgi:hypothetical protein
MMYLTVLRKTRSLEQSLDPASAFAALAQVLSNRPDIDLVETNNQKIVYRHDSPLKHRWYRRTGWPYRLETQRAQVRLDMTFARPRLVFSLKVHFPPMLVALCGVAAVLGAPFIFIQGVMNGPPWSSTGRYFLVGALLLVAECVIGGCVALLVWAHSREAATLLRALDDSIVEIADT